MPGPGSPYTQLDADQVLKQSFDEAEDRLRVDAEVTAVIGTVEVIITDTDDSIKIGNGSGTFMEVNADKSINTHITNTLITAPFDFVGATYPSSTQEVYAYKLGGSGGALVGTITVNYTDATKELITDVTKT